MNAPAMDGGRGEGGHGVRLTVDLDALAANFHTLAALAPRSEVAPVVKADAYGLGAGPVSRRLWSEGARIFFVARLKGGVALRDALGPRRDARIYVLDGLRAGEAEAFSAHRLTPVLSSPEQVALARSAAAAFEVALQVDTGMNRLGLSPAKALALAASADATAGLSIEMVMSHLACGDDPASPMNLEQIERFEAVAAAFPSARTSLAATGGVFLGPRFQGDIVRPGIGLYGGGPGGRPDAHIRPVATLDAPILQVRDVSAGESVGYGATFVASGEMKVAIAAAGYSDGVLRAADRTRYVSLNGARCALLGRISMDLLALDATGLAARVGDRVELFGADLPIDDAARDAATIAYELIAGLTPRVERTYIGDTETGT